MTAIVDRLELERVTRLDLMLAQRYPTKATTRALRMLGRKRRYGGSTINESDITWQCLGGLEVSYSSGSTVTVRSGSALTSNPDPVTETRPAQYTPAPAEADDDTFVLADLVANTNVAPASAIGAATTLHEWWIVYVTTELSAVETDPDRVVFNEGSGGAWVAASDLDKIKRWVLTPGVVRGAGGASLLTVAASVPADSVMIALISVPIGSTDLSSALFFDVRRIVTDPGPNMVSGRGLIGNLANDPGDFVPTVAGSSATCVTGTWWGRLDDQLVFMNTGPAGLSADDICDPNSTWDNTATPASPKLGWLYLAALGDSAIIPRPVKKGANALGAGSGTDEQCFIEGGVVLSTVPPKMGARDETKSHQAHGKIDLRPSATLHLPSFTKGGIEYAYSGMTTTKAICLGPVLYGGVDSGTNLPLVIGPLTVDPEGWFHIGQTATPTTGDGCVGSTALFQTCTAVLSGTTDIVGTFEPKAITISGVSQRIPFTAIEYAIIANGSGLGTFWTSHRPCSGDVYPVVTAVAVVMRGRWESKSQNDDGLQPIFRELASATPSFGDPSDYIKPIITAVRWPYNEPLAG